MELKELDSKQVPLIFNKAKLKFLHTGIVISAKRYCNTTIVVLESHHIEIKWY